MAVQEPSVSLSFHPLIPTPQSGSWSCNKINTKAPPSTEKKKWLTFRRMTPNWAQSALYEEGGFCCFYFIFFLLVFFCATRWQWTHSNVCLLQVKWRHEVAKHDLICGWNWGYWTQYEHTETEWGFLWECLSKTTSLTFRWEMKMTNSHADDFLPWVLQFPSMGSLAETTEQDFLLCHSPEVVSEKDNEHPLAFQVENTMCN